MLALMIGCGLFFLLVGIGLIANTGLFVSTQAQLRSEGKGIAAEVVDAQVTKATKRGTVTSTRYEVKYRFQAPGKGTITSDWQEAPEDVIRAAVEAKTIEVTYLPSDPSVNLPRASIGSNSGAGGTSIWRMLVGAAFAILGLGIMVLGLKGPRAARAPVGQPTMPRSA